MFKRTAGQRSIFEVTHYHGVLPSTVATGPERQDDAFQASGIKEHSQLESFHSIPDDYSFSKGDSSLKYILPTWLRKTESTPQPQSHSGLSSTLA
jgi:hypothetical protein